MADSSALPASSLRCRYCDLPLSTADSHEKMVSNLVQNKLIRSENVIKAMKSVDRKDFVNEEKRAYLDRAVLIGHGSQVIECTCIIILFRYRIDLDSTIWEC
mmetsp:Transcript_36270/g.58690  ORF Transcript_36270/g.58690 Transcript_36270/m.58690 type:complete len:102 (+) Transcript_36270:3-308(+)